MYVLTDVPYFPFWNCRRPTYFGEVPQLSTVVASLVVGSTLSRWMGRATVTTFLFIVCCRSPLRFVWLFTWFVLSTPFRLTVMYGRIVCIECIITKCGDLSLSSFCCLANFLLHLPSSDCPLSTVAHAPFGLRYQARYDRVSYCRSCHRKHTSLLSISNRWRIVQ